MIAPGTVAVFGQMGVLNVGDGDTKLVFDKDDPAEVIRAGRIVRDMLRRGYALLVEVERNGVKTYERVIDFRADTAEYVIADLDPVTAEKADADEREQEQAAGAGETSPGEEAPPRRRGRLPKLRNVDATKARGVAVARSAGG